MAFDITSFLQQSFLGNQVSDYGLAFIAFIFSLEVLRIFKRIILKRLETLAKKTKSDLDDLFVSLLNGIPWSFYMLVSLYFAIQFIILPGSLSKYVSFTVLIAATYYIVLMVLNVLDYSRDKIIAKQRKEDKLEDVSIIKNMASLFLFL